MPLYFYLHEAAPFHQRIRPVLAETWRRRNFEPSRSLCAELAAAAVTFAQRYHTGADEPLLAQIARGGVSFDRDLWRLLVGEVLLYAAASVPEIVTAPDTLSYLLARDADDSAPIRQAHFGSHDLVFSGGFYRPDAAGYNDVADVRRLASYLESIQPAEWTIADLAGLRDFADEDERADELEFAREVFPPLVELYRAARDAGEVVICELL